MPGDPGEGEMVARVTFTLGLGHHSPASAERDTSELEAGVVHWLQARATRRPAARGLWWGSREDTVALFLDAREQVAAHVANTGTGGRGGWDSVYRWAQGPWAQPAPKWSLALGPGAAGGAGAGGGASAAAPPHRRASPAGLCAELGSEVWLWPVSSVSVASSVVLDTVCEHQTAQSPTFWVERLQRPHPGF